jgi:methyl-accepting chemotaxis protein
MNMMNCFRSSINFKKKIAMSVKNLPISVQLTLSIAAALLIALGSMIVSQHGENKEAALNQARDFAHSTHEITLAGLTGMMITGTVDRRDVFLDQIKQLDAVKDLRVTRAPAVSQLFGPGKPDGRSDNAAEEEVMRTGKEINRLESDATGEYLHIVKPAKASTNYLGKNCITCHQVPEGTVLGVVSMKVSLNKVNAAITGQSSKLALAGFLVCLAMFVLVFLFIRHFVSRPLAAMTEGLSQMAKGEADLSQRLPVRKLDEVGCASRAFNEMMDKFAALVSQISNTAGEVRQSVGGLVSAASEVSSSSQEQQACSIGATRAVEAVATGVASIASSADQVRHQSHINLDDSKRGSESLVSLIASMANVRTSVNGIVESVNQFVTSTQSISKMTRQVKDIAEQTNLLALNAEIEAARAGDQGRGFAIVAYEVRKLAKKSSASASDIDQVTQSIGVQSSSLMAAIENGLNQLSRSHDDVNAVAKVMERTAGGVAEVNAGIDAIGSATQEQQLASSDASSNIEQIAVMAKANTASVQGVVLSARHLESLANGLAAAVGKFQLRQAELA